MKWNNELGYLTYQTSLNYIKSSLGIKGLDIVESCDLIPYYTSILKYTSEKLILLGEVGIVEKIREIFNIFNHGTEKIILNSTLDLAWELGIETTDYYLEGTDIPYNQEYLVFAWSNLFTFLSTLLKLSYSHLLNNSNTELGECCSNGCTVGISTEDLEDWSSGVYPEDECYTVTSNNNSWRVGSDKKECTKCYRE